TEILVNKYEDEDEVLKARAKTPLKQDKRLRTLLRNAVDAASDDSGWAHLGAVGNIIAKQAPDFDSRNFGYRKLSDLLAASGTFDLEKRKVGDGSTTSTYVRSRHGA
ncbi:MAG TPA: OST-HTH/LOTUS domain-containing protein, partial [Rhodanobacteraceae bacterium]|nr:OST-HTH/LOTUS domain-containing protein [Rhodanobacteraceae bacterium]